MKLNIAFGLLSLLASAAAAPAPKGQDGSISARDQLDERTWSSNGCSLEQKLVCKVKKCNDKCEVIVDKPEHPKPEKPKPKKPKPEHPKDDKWDNWDVLEEDVKDKVGEVKDKVGSTLGKLTGKL